MKDATRDARAGLRLLNLSSWIRRQAGLRAIYRLFPQTLRDQVSALLAARPSAGARFVRTPAWRAYRSDTSISLKQNQQIDPAAIGVNVFGYIRGQFGLAESARMYTRALIGQGVPVALCDLDLDLPHGLNDSSLDRYIKNDAPHQVNLVFVNPDYLSQALEIIGKPALEGRLLVVCWFWELERVPQDWLPAIARVDAIMVASRFVEDAFRAITSKPIFRVPLPLSPVPDSGLHRNDFGLDAGAFIFLCTFDFNSWIERKNPFAVIDAFRLAFPAHREGVQLLIKSSNGYRYPDKFLRLLNASAVDPRIVVRDDVMDRAHVQALQRCCDVYVSLHRSEGFGLGLAECMALGKPVIATGWSGNLEFMDDRVSRLVSSKKVLVKDGDYPHSIGDTWAEPSIEDAASAMREMADDRAAASRLGQCAKQRVDELLSATRAAQLIQSGLGRLMGGQGVRPVVAPGGPFRSDG